MCHVSCAHAAIKLLQWDCLVLLGGDAAVATAAATDIFWITPAPSLTLDYADAQVKLTIEDVADLSDDVLQLRWAGCLC